MKTQHLLYTIVLAISSISCASTVEFNLESEESFDKAAIAGNWMCVSEKDMSNSKTQLFMIRSWQEVLDNNGSYFSVGTSEFKLNGKRVGTVQIILDGQWIANETHIMTRVDQSKVFAHPNSSEPIVRLAQTQKFISDVVSSSKDTYSIDFKDMMYRAPQGDANETFACFRWRAIQQHCENNTHVYCNMQALTSEQIETVRKQVLSNN